MIILQLILLVLSTVCMMQNLKSQSMTSNHGALAESKRLPIHPKGTVYSAERKKKKKPKPGKIKGKNKGKAKGKSKGKSKGKKPVTTTASSKTTSPTITSLPTTMTSSSSTISSTSTTKTPSPMTTKAIASTSSTSTTSSTKKSTPVIYTSSTSAMALPITTTKTSVSSAPGECKTTSGSSCKFPFKDGNKEYNMCANKDGRYFWCATEHSWGYCKMDRSCPLEGEENSNGCYAKKKPCIFPFKEKKDGKDYNVCKKSGSYFWCATKVDSKGVYTFWESCPKDGSCQLEGQTTITPTTTSPVPTTPSTNGTSTPGAKAIADIENTLKDISTTLQTPTPEVCKSETSDFTESEDKLLEIMADLINYMESNCLKNTTTCDAEKLNVFNSELKDTVEDIKSTSKRSRRDFSYGVYSAFEEKQTVITEITWKVKPSLVIVGDGRGFEPGTVYRVKLPVEKKKDCCTDCKEKYPAENIELCEEYKPSKMCNCYKTMSGKAPNTWRLSSYSSDICDPCPLGYEHKNGYESRSYETSLGDYHSVPNIEKCKRQCEKFNCLTFAYSPKEETCQLNSARITSPTELVYRDYKLCVKQTEGDCECCKSKEYGLKVGPQAPANDQYFYYADRHGYFITKMFQLMGAQNFYEVNIDGNTNYAVDPQPVIQAQQANQYLITDGTRATYMFFLGPSMRTVQASWNAVNGDNNPININDAGLNIFPIYIGESMRLRGRYTDHLTHDGLAVSFRKRWLDAKNYRGYFKHLYFTYFETHDHATAKAYEMVFLSTFDFPANIRDNNNCFHWPIFNLLPIPSATLDKFLYFRQYLNHLKNPIEQVLPLYHIYYNLRNPMNQIPPNANVLNICYPQCVIP